MPKNPLNRIVFKISDRLGIGEAVGWSNVIERYGAKLSGKVVSVDVFDTVLTRRLSTEASVARIAAANAISAGHWDGDLDSYLHQRSSGQGRWPRVEQWFDNDDLVAEERAVEQSLLCPVPGAAEALGGLRAAGTTIVFVSDMHHGAETLREWLDEHALLGPNDVVISSADAGCSKSGGGLHQLVRNSYRPAVHIGNDLWGDFAQAVGARIRPIALRATESNRYERVLELRPHTLGPALSAASRRSRLMTAESPPEHRDILELGSSVVGPAMVAFVQWVVRRCREDGITQVAFLARDGLLPMRVLESLPADHRAGLSLKYIEGNRLAWSLPAAISVGIDEWIRLGSADDGSYLNHSLTVIPFDAVLHRCGLQTSDLVGTALAQCDGSQPLPADLVPEWHQYLESEDCRVALKQTSAMARERMLGYLSSLGLSKQRTAVVDVGWRGTFASMVGDVLGEHLDADVLHFHFGGVDVRTDVNPPVHIERFAIDDSVRPVTLPSPVSCLEAMTASGAPSMRGVHPTDDDEGFAPIYSESQPQVMNESKRLMWGAACHTASLMPTEAELRRWGVSDSSLAPEVIEILTQFWASPSSDEARALSSVYVETDDSGSDVVPMVRPYRFAELALRRPSMRQWRHGSARLTPLPHGPVVRRLLATP